MKCVLGVADGTSDLYHAKIVCILKTKEGTKRLTLTAPSPHLVGSAWMDEDGFRDSVTPTFVVLPF